MEEDAAKTGQSFMTPKSDVAWKAIAILLALILSAVLVFAALIVTGVMKLGLSLL